VTDIWNCIPYKGKRPLSRPRRGWEDNIEMYFQEMWWGGTGWIGLA